MKTVICDLDGTLFDIDHRLYLLEERRFDEFYAACADDTPNEWCVELLKALRDSYRIIFVSGRNESCKQETMRQLLELRLGFAQLHMRPINDRRPDYKFKESLLNGILAPLDIAFAIDDRKQVVDMYRSHGVIVLQCADGEF